MENAPNRQRLGPLAGRDRDLGTHINVSCWFDSGVTGVARAVALV